MTCTRTRRRRRPCNVTIWRAKERRNKVHHAPVRTVLEYSSRGKKEENLLMEYKKKKNLLSHALPQGIPSLRSAKKSRNIVVGWSIDCTVLRYDRRAPGYGIASPSSCSRSVPSRPRQAPLSSPIASVKFVTLYGNPVPVSSRAYVIVF